MKYVREYLVLLLFFFDGYHPDAPTARRQLADSRRWDAEPTASQRCRRTTSRCLGAVFGGRGDVHISAPSQRCRLRSAGLVNRAAGAGAPRGRAAESRIYSSAA